MEWVDWLVDDPEETEIELWGGGTVYVRWGDQVLVEWGPPDTWVKIHNHRKGGD